MQAWCRSRAPGLRWVGVWVRVRLTGREGQGQGQRGSTSTSRSSSSSIGGGLREACSQPPDRGWSTANLATVAAAVCDLAPAHGSGNAAASGAERTTLGSSATAMAQPCHRTVALQLNQHPALGCCETGISADALRAPHARQFALNHTAVWLARRSHAAPPSGRVVDWVTPSDACCWATAMAQQRPYISTCHCSGARVHGCKGADCRNA